MLKSCGILDRRLINFYETYDKTGGYIKENLKIKMNGLNLRYIDYETGI
jgi:hypothetical protein